MYVHKYVHVNMNACMLMCMHVSACMYVRSVDTNKQYRLGFINERITCRIGNNQSVYICRYLCIVCILCMYIMYIEIHTYGTACEENSSNRRVQEFLIDFI